MQRSLVGLATALVLTSAAPALAGGETVVVESMTVTASKSRRPTREIASPVTVIDADEIERTQTEDIRDLVRYLPGISVPFQGQRFGLSGFTIRGLGGNRVQVNVDGVRVPDAFAIGDFANASRNFVDTDTLKQAEFIRGPASSLFGSSALGGVVALTTRDPADWLRSTGKDAVARGRAGYYSADSGWVATGTLAGRNGHWSGLIHYVERRGEELENQGRTGGSGPHRTRPNPHDYTGRNLLAKALYGEGSPNQWRLTLEGNQADSETEVLNLVRTQDFSGLYGMPYLVDTTALDGDDRARRHRVSLDQQLNAPAFAERFEWRVYWQDGLTRQDTVEDRTTLIMGQGSSERRFRRARFEQEIVGMEATGQWLFDTGPVPHDLVAGAELFQTRTRQQRDGQVTNLATGETSNVVGPDSFPVRDFPNSRTLEAAVYTEDRIRLGERLILIPGLRTDYYRLRPNVDSVFAGDNPGVNPVNFSETSLSPRLGMILSLTDRMDLVAQYARGFRSPPYNDVNVGFTNLQFGYTAIPNPDLEPETSDGFEVGIRGFGSAGQFELTAFDNRYRDFIDSLVSLGMDPDTGLLVFQSQNRTRVRIRGVEFSSLLELGQMTPALEGFQLRSALAWARGDDRSQDQSVPLESVDPLNGVVGLIWRPAGSAVDMELVATAVKGKSRVDAEANRFTPPGYLTLDLLTGWEPVPGTRLRAGFFNITDRKYWAWSDVRGRAADSAGLDRFTRPGRSFGVSLSTRF